MKRNERGVTLIALVVTIIVLLILAGVSIAMLTGDNGILTNAKKSQLSNIEAEAIEKMSVAYNTAKTEVMVKASTDVNYTATGKIADLVKTVKKEIGYTTKTADDGTTTELAPTGYSVTQGTNTITITYEDSTFSLGPTDSIVENKKYPKIVGTITVEENDLSYSAPERKVN